MNFIFLNIYNFFLYFFSYLFKYNYIDISFTTGAHLDFELTRIQDIVKKYPQKLPLSVIVSVQEGTKIHVWPNSHHLVSKDSRFHIGKIRSQEISIEPGMACVFRGDLVHCGSDYKQKNVRLFMHLKSDYYFGDGTKGWKLPTNQDDRMSAIIDDL